jgi:uncharacterized protein (PEP-CTERM system associated)
MVITTDRMPSDFVRPTARAFIWGAAALVFPIYANASEWIFTPSLYVQESYSDNIRLAPASDAKSDFVTEVKPAIYVSGNDPHLKMNLFYNLQKLHYSHQPDSLHQELTARTDAELIDNWLFLDARVSNSRRNISAFGPQAFDNIQQSTNQSDVRINHISPFFYHHFPKLATAELRFEHDTVRSSGNLLDVSTDKILLTLIGDNFLRDWNWDAYYNTKQIDDTSLRKSRGHSEAFSLHHHVSDRLDFFLTNGYENENYLVNSGAQPEGRFWSAGANWSSNRSTFSLSAGKRFFGNTYSLNISRRSRKSTWSFGYGEDIVSTASEFIRLSQNDSANLLNELWSADIPNPVVRMQVVNAFLKTSQLFGHDKGAINYFSHSYFLQRQLRFAVAATSAKITILTTITATRRSAQTHSEIDSKLLFSNQQISNNITQIGGSAIWNWRMSARTSINVSATYDHITDKSERRDQNFAFALGLSRGLARNVSGSIDLRHMRHTSTQSGASYRENGISAALNLQL